MLLQLHDIYEPNKVSDHLILIAYNVPTYRIPTSFNCISQMKVKVKVISGSRSGVVAAEARKVHTRWVVLDK